MGRPARRKRTLAGGQEGVIRARIDDFVVEEIPSYLPCGAGAHTYAFIEKRGLTTRDVVSALAESGVPRGRPVGFAGQKDRHAVARQWISVPAEHRDALNLLDDVQGLAVLETSLHRNKLGLGPPARQPIQPSGAGAAR